MLCKLLPALAMFACRLGAQEPESLLAKLRKLQLAEQPGPVPVLYARSAEQRAIAYQKSLNATHAWYEEQLGVHVPVKLLAVLDQDAWEKFSPGSPYPFLPFTFQLGIVISADMDKFPAMHPAPLPGEFVLGHEVGHIFCFALKIGGPSFTNEFFANLFSAAYILAKRPDLKFVLDGPPAETWKASPRYTSLADLNYLYSSVGSANYIWFMNHLERIAGLFMKDQSFPKIIRKLQSSFPVGDSMPSPRAIPLEDIYARLEAIRPGFRKMLGPLDAPSTIARMMPSSCPTVLPKRGTLIVQNDSADTLRVTDFEARVNDIPAHAWTRFSGAVKLSSGNCLVPSDEPSLAIVKP